MYIRNLTALGLVAAVAAACGNDPTDRALSGGAIGAAGGAAAGELISGDPLVGGLAGAAAGAAVGGLTDGDDFDLGEPIWSNW